VNVRTLTMQLGKRKGHYHGPNVASKSAHTQHQPKHVHAMKNQTRLTEHMFTKSSSRSSHLHSPALSRAALRVPLVVSSHTPLNAPSLSITPSVPASLEPSPDPPSTCDSSCAPLVLELDSQDNEVTCSEGEEDDIDYLLDAAGSEPKGKEEVCGWEELQEQIKEDQRRAHKEHKPLTYMNQLTILRNFATLHIKGLRHIATSKEIVQQWHESAGVHFAYQIQFMACHYQLFEQLPAKR
jgi:hypothetical protein